MIAGKISFQLSNNLPELNTLRQNMEAFVKSLKLSPKRIFEINLAMEEIFANIIMHGYTDNKDHWIKIEAWMEDGQFVIRIEDDGIPFNPVEHKSHNLECPIEEREIGGLGIHLIKRCACDIVYERRGDKNVLILKKNLKKANN